MDVGYNNFGQLGNDNTSSISSPIQTICGGNNWKSVSCGFRTTAAIKNDGTLWLWGEGGDGQLGNDSELNISSPVQTVMGGNNWVSVLLAIFQHLQLKRFQLKLLLQVVQTKLAELQ